MKTMSEPVHDTKQDAIEWVLANTDHTIWREFINEDIVRVGVNPWPTVMTLKQDHDGKHFWSDARQIS